MLIAALPLVENFELFLEHYKVVQQKENERKAELLRMAEVQCAHVHWVGVVASISLENMCAYVHRLLAVE